MLGLLPAIRAPFPALSLETTAGTYLYVGAVILLGVGYFFADRREKADRKREKEEEAAAAKRYREELETKSEERHRADLAATVSVKTVVLREVESLRRNSDDMVKAAVKIVQESLAQGRPTPAPEVAELAESMRTSVATIDRALSMRAETGVFKVTGYPQPKGQIPETKAPLFDIAKVPSSGKPPS
jgi:uncharacterized protein with FMN-binding domain